MRSVVPAPMARATILPKEMMLPYSGYSYSVLKPQRYLKMIRLSIGQAYVHLYMYVYMYMYTKVFACGYIHVCVRAHLCAHLTCICVCIFFCVCVCVCTCRSMCIYVYIYI